MVYTKNNHRGDKSLIILRGVSSSGKTSFSKLLKSLNVECVEVSADDYFYSNYDGSNPDGNYKFNPEKLGSAHGECRRKFQKAVDSGAKCVIVSNTNVEKSHWEFYEEYGKEKGYDYIYGSGDAAPSILYAKENYDITKEVIKMVNDKYKSEGKKEETPKETKK